MIKLHSVHNFFLSNKPPLTHVHQYYRYFWLEKNQKSIQICGNRNLFDNSHLTYSVIDIMKGAQLEFVGFCISGERFRCWRGVSRDGHGVSGWSKDFLGMSVRMSRRGVTALSPVISEACEDPVVRIVCRIANSDTRLTSPYNTENFLLLLHSWFVTENQHCMRCLSSV